MSELYMRLRLCYAQIKLAFHSLSYTPEEYSDMMYVLTRKAGEHTYRAMKQRHMQGSKEGE